ncbi:MAG TPA: hypothetical protein VD772_08310, partial [Anseongella sp.]|nr:hypothetical protein [Anseongella sp.]
MRMVCVGIALLFQSFHAASQQKARGTVFGADSSERISLVHVINKNTGALVLTGYKGEFEIRADAGDILAFVKDGYRSRAVPLANAAGPLSVYLSKKPVPPAA